MIANILVTFKWKRGEEVLECLKESCWRNKELNCKKTFVSSYEWNLFQVFSHRSAQNWFSYSSNIRQTRSICYFDLERCSKDCKCWIRKQVWIKQIVVYRKLPPPYKYLLGCSSKYKVWTCKIIKWLQTREELRGGGGWVLTKYCVLQPNFAGAKTFLQVCLEENLTHWIRNWALHRIISSYVTSASFNRHWFWHRQSLCF